MNRFRFFLTFLTEVYISFPSTMRTSIKKPSIVTFYSCKNSFHIIFMTKYASDGAAELFSFAGKL